MYIVFSANNNQETMVIPFPPSALSIEQEQENTDFEGLSGTLKIIGNMGLRTLSFSSFFSLGVRMPGMNQYATENGWAYIDFFERWRNRKVPLRIVITTDEREVLNMPCVIDNFTWQKKCKRITYTINISEYRFAGE